MAYDSGTVRAVAHQCSLLLTGARTEKIKQPAQDVIEISFRAEGGTRRLIISASSNVPAVYISERARENSDSAPNFCMLLRKYLASSKLVCVYQLGFERAIRFVFSSRDEMGYEREISLICEVMGKYSNVIITDSNEKILGVLKPIDFSDSDVRQLLIGLKYTLPPTSGKRDPFGVSKEEFICGYDGNIGYVKYLMSRFLGISKLIANEIVYRAKEESIERLFEEFSFYLSSIEKNEYSCAVLRAEGTGDFDYSVYPITQFADKATARPYDSVSAMIEDYYHAKENANFIKQRAFDMLRAVNNSISKIERKNLIQQGELEECEKMDECKHMGDLIISNVYAIKSKAKFVDVIDYSEEEMPTVRIPLDDKLSGAANAQRYYKKYNKYKKAKQILTEQLEKNARELEYLESVKDFIMRSTTQNELDEIRAELQSAGYLGKTKERTVKKNKKQPMLKFITDSGLTVLCGRNNIENEQITHKIAARSDWWFHVKGAPGSHVVMLCEHEPTDKDFEQAASVAALNSSVCDKNKSGKQRAEVDYTQVKNLKKTPNSFPGFVTYTVYYSMVSVFEAEEIEALGRQ